jgi:hypothetical protein
MPQYQRTHESGTCGTKRHGVVLGASCHELHKKKRLAIDAFVVRMITIIQELQFLGFTTVRSTMEEQNRRGVPRMPFAHYHRLQFALTDKRNG